MHAATVLQWLAAHPATATHPRNVRSHVPVDKRILNYMERNAVIIKFLNFEWPKQMLAYKLWFCFGVWRLTHLHLFHCTVVQWSHVQDGKRTPNYSERNAFIIKFLKFHDLNRSHWSSSGGFKNKLPRYVNTRKRVFYMKSFVNCTSLLSKCKSDILQIYFLQPIGWHHKHHFLASAHLFLGSIPWF